MSAGYWNLHSNFGALYFAQQKHRQDKKAAAVESQHLITFRYSFSENKPVEALI